MPPGSASSRAPRAAMVVVLLLGILYALSAVSARPMGFDLLRLFGQKAFDPHGARFLWLPSLLWAFVVSNGLVALAYYSLPASLIYFARRRQDLAYRWVFVLFGAFILACGTTHIMDIVTLWYPIYWLQMVVVAVTAVLSIGTAIAVWRIMPAVLRLPSHQQVLALDARLSEQVSRREHAEQALSVLSASISEQAGPLEAIFEAMTEGIAIYNVQGAIVKSNSAFQELLGLCADVDYRTRGYPERVGALFPRSLDGQPIPREQWLLTRALGGEVIPANEAPDALITTRDGRERILSRSAAPIRDAQGMVMGAVIVVRDVTTRRQVEHQAAEQASQLEAIFEAKANGVGVYDTQGHFLRANRALHQLFGHDSDREYTTLSLTERAQRLLVFDEHGQPVPEGQWPQWRVLRGELLAGATAVDLQVQTLDGREVWVNTTGAPIHGPDGQVTGVVLIVRDVTARRQLERQVAEQERLFRTLVENTPDVIGRFDHAGRFLYVNPAVQAAFGVSRAEVEGRLFSEWASADRPLGVTITAGSLASSWPATMHEAISNWRPVDYELNAQVDGKRRHYRGRVLPERGEDGTVLSFLFVVTDITELREAEEALAEQERQYRTLVEHSPDIIARFDREQRYLYVSPAIRRVSPIPPDAYYGKTNAELGWPETFAGPARRAIEAVFQTGQSRVLEESNTAERDAEGAHYYRAQILPEFAEDGTVTSVLTVTSDITELKRTEVALRLATAAAEAAREEEHRGRLEAERRKQIAESLRGVLAILNSNRPLDEVLRHIVRQVGCLLGSEAAAIFGADSVFETPPVCPLAQALTLQAAVGRRLSSLRRNGSSRRLPFAHTAVQQALASQSPVAVLDGAVPTPRATADRATRHASLPVLLGTLPAPYQALLVVPIRVHEKIYGCLLLFYTQPCHFSNEEVALALAYADQAGLAIANARLQEHIAQEATTAERNRLARELHDTVTQEIFSASLLAEGIPVAWQNHRATAEEALHHLHRLTQGALAGLRVLLLELRPAALAQMPLSQLLRHLGAAMTTRAGVPITVGIEGEELPLPEAVKIALYRIAQEALTNAAKYARARGMWIRLQSLDGMGRIELEITDDGQGFDPGAIPAGHFGLAMMRERARAVNATVDVRSQRGKGTQVVVDWQGSPQPAAAHQEVVGNEGAGSHSRGPRR
jgi:PAS domain S-box-containing protein